MGDIVRKVNICGLTSDGEILKCVAGVDALIDTGSTTTVISVELAARLGGRNLKKHRTQINNRSVPLKLVGIKLNAAGCDEDALTVAVDAESIKKAGKTITGDAVEVILGHDYLQRKRAAMRYVDGGSKVACRAAKPRKAR